MGEADDGARDRSVERAVRDLGLTGLTPVGGGLEFRVWRARHPRWGEVALRAPQRPVESNANDPHVDTAESLRHEVELYELLRPLGVPVPRCFDLRHDEVDVAICEFVPGDDSAPSSREVGRIAARLHGLDLPAGLAVPTALTGRKSAAEFAPTIAERLTRRWAVLRTVAPTLPDLPDPPDLAALVDPANVRSLLHLDLRAANLIARSGRIRAVIDWSNSLIGDAALELARLEQYARLPENQIDYPDLLAGYAKVHPIPERSRTCWDFYRLDAAAMLAVVFNFEAPDPVRGPESLRHLVRLHAASEL